MFRVGWDWEYYVDDKTMKQAMKARKVIEDDKIQKRKDKNGTSSSEHKGLGKRKSEVTNDNEEDDGFEDGEDEDNPFA